MRELSIRGLGAQVKLCSVDELIHGEDMDDSAGRLGCPSEAASRAESDGGGGCARCLERCVNNPENVSRSQTEIQKDENDKR